MDNIKYIITIIDRKTGSVSYLERTSSDVSETITKKLGGWDNLRAASTSSGIKNEYAQAGYTRDSTKIFSILAVNINL